MDTSALSALVQASEDGEAPLQIQAVGPIINAVSSADGALLAVLTTCLVQVFSGSPLRWVQSFIVPDGSQGTGLCFSRDGRTLAVSGADHIWLCDRESGAITRGPKIDGYCLLVGPDRYLPADFLGYSPDGRLLWFRHKTLLGWLQDGQPAAVDDLAPRKRLLHIGPNSPGVLFFGEPPVAPASGDPWAGVVRQGDDALPFLSSTIIDPLHEPVRQPFIEPWAALSPDGRWLFAAAGVSDGQQSTATHLLWDLDWAHPPCSLDSGDSSLQGTVAFSPTSRLLAYVDLRGAVVVRDLHSRATLCEIPNPTPEEYAPAIVEAIRFWAEDAMTVIWEGDQRGDPPRLGCFRLPSGAPVTAPSAALRETVGMLGLRTSRVFRQGSYIGGEEVRVYDGLTGALERTDGVLASADACAVSASGVLSWAQDRRLFLEAPDCESEEYPLDAGRCIALEWSEDGTVVMATCVNGITWARWDRGWLLNLWVPSLSAASWAEEGRVAVLLSDGTVLRLGVG